MRCKTNERMVKAQEVLYNLLKILKFESLSGSSDRNYKKKSSVSFTL